MVKLFVCVTYSGFVADTFMIRTLGFLVVVYVCETILDYSKNL